MAPDCISVFAVCSVAVVIIWRGASRDRVSSHCPATHPLNTTLDAKTTSALDLSVWPSDAAELLKSVPIILFGFNAHLQARALDEGL